MKTKFTLAVALVAIFLPTLAEAGNRRCRSNRSYDYNCRPRCYTRPYYDYGYQYRAPIFQSPRFRYGGPVEARGQYVPHGYGSHYRPAVRFFNY